MPRRDSAPLSAHALTGRKLGTAVLFYVLGVIGVITLEPFHFEVPARIAIILWDDYNWLDPFANVVLFVPPGFLYALARSATRTHDARWQTTVEFVKNAGISRANTDYAKAWSLEIVDQVKVAP